MFRKNKIYIFAILFIILSNCNDNDKNLKIDYSKPKKEIQTVTNKNNSINNDQNAYIEFNFDSDSVIKLAKKNLMDFLEKNDLNDFDTPIVCAKKFDTNEKIILVVFPINNSGCGSVIFEYKNSNFLTYDCGLNSDSATGVIQQFINSKDSPIIDPDEL